jgi:hypothetical protein
MLAALSMVGAPARALAQAPEASPQALVAARELFREATGDVDAGRFDAALGKFRRVAGVKETYAVRFNIARCEEQLGKLGAALGDYELAEREGAGDPKGADISKLAQERAAALRPRVPRLTIAPPSDPPADLVVKLDGQAQPGGTLGVALPVDPGAHKVDATSSKGSFTKEVTLREGESADVTVTFPPAPVAPPPAPPSVGDTPILPAPVEQANRVPGYVVLGVGGALGITSVVFLLLHNQAASDLATQKTTDCTLPGGICPPGARNQLDPLQSSAKRDEGLAIGFAIGAAAAVGVGLYLVLNPPKQTSASSGTLAPKTTTPSARLVPAPGGVMVLGEF